MTDDGDGTLIGEDCYFEPNIFLMSIIEFVGAFFISITLKNFRSSGYLSGKTRNFLSDFAVIIAILIMSTATVLYLFVTTSVC